MSLIQRRTARSLAALAAAALGAAVLAIPSGAEPSPSIAAHVKNFTFWRQSGLALQVPAQWAAANVTFAEIGNNADAIAFKAAGGRHAIVYTDPNYYYQAPDYHSHGNFPESAYGHDPSGNRISRPQGHGVEYYLLPNSPQALAAYRDATAADVGGVYDMVFADGVSDTLNTSLYRMSSAPVEISSDDDYVEGMKRMLAVASRPVIANGFNNGNPLNFERYLDAPNVAGIYGETCFYRDSGPKADQLWHNDAQALLSITAHRRYAFCGGRGLDMDNRAGRMFWLASWWLTYDPHYSVAVEHFASPGSVFVFPETQIVPTQPVQNPGRNIDRLQTATGAYVRQFNACYQNRAPLGRCVAIVNPSSSSPATIPSWIFRRYSRVLSLDTSNLFYGGTARFTHGLPISLGPSQATILAQ